MPRATLSAQETKTESISLQQSRVLVKNMFRLSVSSICYLRGIFPDDCFSTKDYAGVKVHQLECAEKDNDGNLIVLDKDAFLLTQWLERGVFDALEQSYLKSLSFCIYKRNTAPSSLKKVTDDDILLECYNFGIQYSDEALTMNGVPMTRDSLKKQAVAFIRCLVEFSNTLDSLPEERYLTMRMSYYDNKTPKDYQPEFFAVGNDVIKFVSKPVKVRVGSLMTPFLSMNLKFAGLETYDILDEYIGEQGVVAENDDEVDYVNDDATAVQSPVTERKRSRDEALNADMSPSELEWSAGELKTLNCQDEVKSARTCHVGLSELGQQLSSSTLNETRNYTKESSNYELVKQFVLSERRAVMKECAAKCKISPSDIRLIFRKLSKDGILVQNGHRYAVSGSYLANSDTISKNGRSEKISIEEPLQDADALRSWSEKKGTGDGHRDMEEEKFGEEMTLSQESRDLLAAPSGQVLVLPSSQGSCDSIVFTTSPPTKIRRNKAFSSDKISKCGRQQQLRLKTVSFNHVASKNDLASEKIDSFNTRKCTDLPLHKTEDVDDEETIGYEAAICGEFQEPEGGNEDESKRKHYYLSQDGETTAISGQPPQKRQKCSVIAEPIHQHDNVVLDSDSCVLSH